MTPQMTPQIVLGIDPGLATTGYALIQDNNNNSLTVLDYGVISTAAQENFAERLKQIHQALNKLIKKYRPEVLAVEQLYFAKNVKTALSVGQARGVIVLTGILHKLPIFDFTPLQVKQSVCGYGKAEKSQVQKMVKNILKLAKIPQPDDAADALAVALTYLQSKVILNKLRPKA